MAEEKKDAAENKKEEAAKKEVKKADEKKAEAPKEEKKADKAEEKKAEEKKPAAKKEAKKETPKKEEKKAEEKKPASEKKEEKKPVAEKKAEKSTAGKATPEKEPVKEEAKAEAKAEPKKAEKAPAPAQPKPGDFDWEAAQDDDYSKTDRAKYDEIYEDTLTSISEKEVIEGTVVAVTKKEVVINVGYKSEGLVSLNEFRYNPDLKVDDKVDVYVEAQEDKNGQLVLSHKKARTHKAWDNVNKALETGEVIMGHIKCRTKGGLIVDVFGIEAFLPGSQIDVKPIRDYDQFVDKNMEFKVVKINHEFKNVVVSHKALIEAELEEQKKQIIGGLEKGQVLEGTVKNITSYGVFIDLGGVDGLIHITDLSWGRVNHPEEIVELDQKLNVVILDFDDDKKRIALGLKQLQKHPWDNLDEKLQVGDTVKGKVVVLADYGAFVEIQPGVEGLIHVSEMSWSQHLRSAQDFLKVGDEIEAVILTLDREERKMSLGIKQLMPDPWEDIEKRYPVDSKHKAEVKNFTNFGVFVELEEGVDGLIHISDLSWSKKIKHPSEFCKVGDTLEVVVLELDKENRRLSLGHKQLEENPWDVFAETFAEDTVHKGTLIEAKDKSMIVSLPYGMEGVCPQKHLRKEDGENLKMDETADFKVIEFNRDAKKIVVSHTRTFEEAPEGEAPKKKKRTTKSGGSSKAVKNLNKNAEKTTLGDLDALSALKDEMEKGKDDK